MTVCGVERSREAKDLETRGREGPGRPGTQKQPLRVDLGRGIRRGDPGVPRFIKPGDEDSRAGPGPGKEQPRARVGGQRTPGWGGHQSGLGAHRETPKRGQGFSRGLREWGRGRPKDAGAGGTVDRGAGPGRNVSVVTGKGRRPAPGRLRGYDRRPRPAHTHLSAVERTPPGQAPLAPPAAPIETDRK